MKSKYVKELADVGSFAFLLGLAYVGCYLAIGEPFQYGGPCFSTMLIWAVAHVGGVVFGFLRMPPLLGMLLSGMMLQNAVPAAVSPLPKEWSKGFRAVALGTIFLRSGFELDLEVFRKVGPAAVRLLLIPGLVEAFVTGGLASVVFGMSPLLGFTLGFILKAVGPAVVIQTMFDVQSSGYGVEKGIPSIVVGAASFDDMVALTGYSLFSNLALAHGSGGQLVWKMFHGPLDLVLGITAGLLGAILCSLTTIWNTRLKRQLVTFITAMVLLFTLYHYKFNAGGALSCIVLGLFTSYFWEHGTHFFFGVPGYLSVGPSSTFGHDVEHMVGRFWRFFAQPLLFGIIGGLMDFKKLDTSTIPLSLGIIVAGICVRMPTTFLAMAGAGLNLKERLFVAAAWMPKATVQAALAAAPLDMIRAAGRKDLEDEGMDILTTAVFAILVCAPLGVLLIHFSTPYLLAQAPRQQSMEDKPKLEEITEEDTARSPRPSARGPAPPPGSPIAVTSPDGHRPTSPDQHSNLVNPLLHYIMGNESGFCHSPSTPSSEDANSGWPNHTGDPGMRRSATSPAMLHTLDKPPAPRSVGSLNGLPTPRDLHVPSDQDPTPAQLAQAQAQAERPAGTPLVAPAGGAAEAYLRSVERLAAVVEAEARSRPEGGDSPSTSNAAELLEAVRALRQELLAEGAVEESAEAVETARSFFREAQSATSLPQVGAVLHSIQVHVSARGC